MRKVHVDGIPAIGTALNKFLIVYGAAGEVQDMHPGYLRDGIRGIRRHVPDHDATGFAQFQVDVVHARSGLADELEPGCGIQEGLVHNDFVQAGDVCVLDPLPGFFRRGAGIAHEFPQGSHFLQGDIAHGDSV